MSLRLQGQLHPHLHPANAPERYRSRLSGPLLDRIDLHIEVPRVPHKDLTDQSPAEDSATIRQWVNQVRQIQSIHLAEVIQHRGMDRKLG